MYRIEVAAGEEAVFRTLDELATGIRNGLITPRSRIYHGASQKWLPIEFHPHYKKALQLATGGAPVNDTGLTRPVPPSRRSSPEIPRAPAAPRGPAAAPAPSLEPPAVVAETRAVATIEPPARELVLPDISYPEVAPSGDSMPVARRRRGGSGRFVVGCVAAVALIGGYVTTRPAAAPASSEVAAEPPSTNAAEPPAMHAAEAPPLPAAESRRSSARPPEATSRPTGPVSQAWSSSAGAVAPAPTPVRAAPVPTSEPPAIMPPPAALDLSLTSAPLDSSLVPATAPQRDSAAIRRILRAVSGAPAGGSTGR